MAYGTVPSLVENAFELLDTPGEFYTDPSAGRIYYRPRAGQSLPSADVEIPMIETLIDAKGTLADPVSNVVIQNLQFSYTSWLAPGTGVGVADIFLNYALTQPNQAAAEERCVASATPNCFPQYMAGTPPSAAVQFHAAASVKVLGNTFANLGGSGLDLNYGIKNSSVVGNEFTDIAENGIQLGRTDDPNPEALGADDREITEHNTIADNYIHRIGTESDDSAAIVAPYTRYTTISHNTIENVPYIGIAVGWGQFTGFTWGPRIPTIMQNNVVRNNLINDAVQKISDGGAIYFESAQGTSAANGAQVAGNVIFNVVRGALGIYTDVATAFLTVTGNVTYAVRNDIGGCYTSHIVYTANYWQGHASTPCPISPYPSSATNHLITSLHQVPASVLAASGLETAHIALDAPTVTSVAPVSAAPGTRVTITGQHLVGATAVYFGGVPVGRDATSWSRSTQRATSASPRCKSWRWQASAELLSPPRDAALDGPDRLNHQSDRGPAVDRGVRI